MFGLLVDKDLAGVVQPLRGAVQGWAVAPLDTARSRPASELEAALANLGTDVKSYSSVAAALDGQCALATADDEILLFGSFFCVGEALQWLDRQATEDGANGIAG
ncbi:Bifunctional protein FolC [compost metagenome]